MSGLIDTTEMYLRTIIELEEEGVPAMRARIVERLGHSGPTVSQTIGRMERDGLVRLGGSRVLELTGEGRQAAVSVLRRHRLAERMLSDLLGVDWDDLHEEACRLEHVLSERLERQIVARLDGPMVTPYGTPVPGLDGLGVDEVEASYPSTTLWDVASVAPREVTIAALPEGAQLDRDLLRQMRHAGVVPGGRVTVVTSETGVVVDGVSMSARMAREVRVRV